MKKFVVLSSLLFLVACNNEETVTLEEYENLQEENEILQEKNEELQTEVDELEASVERLENDVLNLINEDSQLSEENEIEEQEDEVEESEQRYNGTKDDIPKFLESMEEDLENVEFNFIEEESLITVTYTGALEDTAELALSQEGTSAYEEDIQVMNDMTKLYSDTILETFGEGYTVQLILESNPEPFLNKYKDGELLEENFDEHTDRVLNE